MYHGHAGPAALALAMLAALAPRLAAQELAAYCTDAETFLTAEVGMVAVTEPDTIDDWRTHRQVPGCHITAAGTTRLTEKEIVARFFPRLEAAGWTRTPDPKDAPREASLRYRKDGADCLFGYYMHGMLGTPAEGQVEDATPPAPGERRYSFYVMCMPAMNLPPP